MEKHYSHSTTQNCLNYIQPQSYTQNEELFKPWDTTK